MTAQAERSVVEGPAGVLEALVESPAEALAVAIVCHPHPLHGGTMHNKVTFAVARAFRRLRAHAVRFNFRGVGGSAGRHAHGEGELDDARAVLAWARRRWPGLPVFLGGFSFGAMIAFRVSDGTAGLVLVAPPVTSHALEGESPQDPWLVVHGDRDELVPVDAVRAWCRARSPAPSLVVIEGATHFFHGKLGSVSAAVESHFAGRLGERGM